MKLSLLSRIVISLLIALLICGPALPVFAQPPALPAQRGLSSMIPLLGLVSAWMHRNRTYRNAEEFMADAKDEYKAEIATLDQLHQQNRASPLPGLTPDQQEAAYQKQLAALTNEEAMAIDFGESIKRGARHDFNQALKQEIINTVLSTGVVRNLFGALGNGLGDAQKLVDNALSDLQKTGSVGSEVAQLQKQAQLLKMAAGLIGGSDGATLGQTAQDVVDKVTNTMTDAQNTLTGIKRELDSAQAILGGLQDNDYVPTSSELTQTLALQLVGLGQGNATTDALLNLLGFKPGSSTEAMRLRWEQLENEGYRVRCQTWKKNWAASLKAYAEQLSVEESPTEEEAACKELTPDDLTVNGGEVSAKPSATSRQSAPSGATGQLGHFQETDCNVAGLHPTNVHVDYYTSDPNKGPYLGCSDPASGGFTITTWSDTAQLSTFLQKESAVYQGFVDSANQWNTGLADPKLTQHVTFVRHDANRYVVAITGYSNVQNCIEGQAYGFEIVDGRFGVKMDYTLDGNCGPSEAAYPTMMQSMEAAALAAIARVEGNPGP